MIAVIQRVNKANVKIEGKIYNKIGKGYVIFLNIVKNDTLGDVVKLAKKIADLRIMADSKGKMNLSLKEVGCQILIISQFTLCANLKAGRRPDFTKSADPKTAWHLYREFAKEIKKHIRTVRTGQFKAMMEVELVNDGPVTIIADSKII